MPQQNSTPQHRPKRQRVPKPAAVRVEAHLRDAFGGDRAAAFARKHQGCGFGGAFG